MAAESKAPGRIAQAACAIRVPRPMPVGEPLATLDRYTCEGLTAGRITPPGRSVHVGVWFRLLRSLLGEGCG